MLALSYVAFGEWHGGKVVGTICGAFDPSFVAVGAVISDEGLFEGIEIISFFLLFF